MKHADFLDILIFSRKITVLTKINKKCCKSRWWIYGKVHRPNLCWSNFTRISFIVLNFGREGAYWIVLFLWQFPNDKWIFQIPALDIVIHQAMCHRISYVFVQYTDGFFVMGQKGNKSVSGVWFLFHRLVKTTNSIQIHPRHTKNTVPKFIVVLKISECDSTFQRAKIHAHSSLWAFYSDQLDWNEKICWPHHHHKLPQT